MNLCTNVFRLLDKVCFVIPILLLLERGFVMGSANKRGLHLEKYSCRNCYSNSHYTKDSGAHTDLFCTGCDAFVVKIPKYNSEKCSAEVIIS